MYQDAKVNGSCTKTSNKLKTTQIIKVKKDIFYDMSFLVKPYNINYEKKHNDFCRG